jgi:hypothetical protein
MSAAWESHTLSFVIFCEVLWHPTCTIFCSFGAGQCCVHYPVKCLVFQVVSELNASVLPTTGNLHDTHLHLWSMYLGIWVLLLSRALHHSTPVSLTLHVLCAPPPTTNECQLMWQSSFAEIRSYCILQHLTMFQYACHLSKLPVHRQATLQCPPVTTTNMVHGEICSWLVLFHRRHAVTLFYETSLYFVA